MQDSICSFSNCLYCTKAFPLFEARKTLMQLRTLKVILGRLHKLEVRHMSFFGAMSKCWCGILLRVCHKVIFN